MKIHIISETEFIVKGTGVHTAFVDHTALLKEKDDLDVIINGEGYGDICHGHTYGLYYLWKGRKYRGRRVFTVHVTPESARGSIPIYNLLAPLVTYGLRLVYSYSDVCIAISPEVENSIRSTGARTRIVRIYNPVNTEFWRRNQDMRRQGRNMLGISDKEFVIIGSGQLIGRKGVEDFIDIAGSVPDARFVWAGGRPFGKFSEGIKRIDNKIRNASRNFLYAGNFDLEIMPLIYAAADLMLFPSYQENCPLAPLEAAASGMPVIYRDLNEYKSLYERPYLAAATTEHFTELCIRMMKDRVFYDSGMAISNQILIQFDKDIIRNKLVSLYTSLLESSESATGYRNSTPEFSIG
jgi:1,2-diacylglycerol-3-alpha-glucose alpha-1,2-galactosyltransferase